MTRLMTPASIVGALALLMVSASHAQTSASSPSQDIVIVEERGVVRLIDPASGEVQLQLGHHGALSGAVAVDGTIYVSTTAGDDSGAEVFAVRPSATSPEPIGRVPELALANRLSPAGDGLRLLTFAPGFPITTPTGVTTLPLPAPWQRAPRGITARDLGGGILSPDGATWYHLRTLHEGDRMIGVELQALTFREGEAPTESNLQLAMSDYTSLLMSPNGGALQGNRI